MKRSLAGIRVVAVEQAVAGPICSRHLADLGAEVIKIERPGGGDFSRQYDDHVHGWSSHFVWLNRGKRSVELDLKSSEGRQALESLLLDADVFLSNLGPGAIARIIPDARLVAVNPRLIRCYVSGYGASGPFAERKAYDALIQGEAGAIAATGTPDHLAKPGVSVADLAGGLYALAGINAALFSRERTGVAERLDISLFDVLLEWMSPLLLAQRYTGEVPPPAGLSHASIAPYGAYGSADGDIVMIAVQNEGQWRRFCSGVLESPTLADHPDFVRNVERVTHRDALERHIVPVLATLPTTVLVKRLETHDVPYGSLNQISDVLNHPQAEASERWSEATLPGLGSVMVVTTPFSKTAEQAADAKALPTLGEHTDEVLAGGWSRTGN